jgi:hypothetical protein
MATKQLVEATVVCHRILLTVAPVMLVALAVAVEAQTLPMLLVLEVLGYLDRA